jgi:hypothetical protein
MVSPVLRAQRNAYWKAPLEAQRGLSAAQGSYVEDAPEFPSEPDDAWVMATFEAFHVFAIDPDYQLTYTELNFRIEKVFKQAASLSLSSESLIDADMPGGRIKSPNGDILSFRIAPFPYFFLLGHKYLVHLSYQAQGGFFFAGKRWDISSGRVQPDDPGEIGRAAHGKSSIAGKSVTDLVNYLPSVLPDGVADH